MRRCGHSRGTCCCTTSAARRAARVDEVGEAIGHEARSRSSRSRGSKSCTRLLALRRRSRRRKCSSRSLSTSCQVAPWEVEAAAAVDGQCEGRSRRSRCRSGKLQCRRLTRRLHTRHSSYASGHHSCIQTSGTSCCRQPRVVGAWETVAVAVVAAAWAAVRSPNTEAAARARAAARAPPAGRSRCSRCRARSRTWLSGGSSSERGPARRSCHPRTPRCLRQLSSVDRDCRP